MSKTKELPYSELLRISNYYTSVLEIVWKEEKERTLIRMLDNYRTDCDMSSAVKDDMMHLCDLVSRLEQLSMFRRDIQLLMTPRRS